MSAPRLRRAAVPLVGAASAPLGHLLAYQAQFGSAAARVESSGAHAYFPVVVGSLTAGLGAAVLASLLVLAVARLIVGRRRGATAAGRRQSVLELLAVLFTVQLGVFLVQEAAEALVTGSAIAPLPELLLWGAFGQLPVAAVAALLLSWLSVRLEVALRGLHDAAGSFQPRLNAVCRQWTPVSVDDPLRGAALCAFAKRGPPRPLLQTAIQ